MVFIIVVYPQVYADLGVSPFLETFICLAWDEHDEPHEFRHRISAATILAGPPVAIVVLKIGGYHLKKYGI